MAYDSFLVKAGLANTRKFRRLKPQEGWCAVMGVWSIAAQSPVRGYLFIAEGEPATEQDFADEAKVTLAVARATLKKMRALGMIEMDSEMDCEHIHDWFEHQKDPKPSESPEAWRARKRAERARKRAEQSGKSRGGHAGVPRDTVTSHADVTPPKLREEKEKENESAAHSRKRAGSPIDQNAFPADLPADLREGAIAVLAILRRVFDARGGQEPGLRGVGMALASYPRRDHLREARDFEHWATVGAGLRSNRTDWVGTFRNWLAKAPDAAPQRATASANGASAYRRKVEVIEV